MNDEQRRLGEFWAQPKGTGPFSRNPALRGPSLDPSLRLFEIAPCDSVSLAYVAILHGAREALRENGRRRGAVVNVNRP